MSTSRTGSALPVAYEIAQAETTPTVTVGMPVRNGAARIEQALADVLRQTHRALRIVVSDNCSDDDTEARVRAVMRFDARVEYVRLSEPVAAQDNFKTVWQLADTPYFMWAADDDFRSPEYIEKLIAQLERQPTAMLAFGQIVHFGRHGHPEENPRPQPRVEVRGLSQRNALRRISACCGVVYGVFRTSALQDYGWHRHEAYWDLPLLVFLATRKTMVADYSVTFFQYVPPPSNASVEALSARHGMRPSAPFVHLRLARAAYLAAGGNSVRRIPPLRSIHVLWQIADVLFRQRWRSVLYDSTPIRLRPLLHKASERVDAIRSRKVAIVPADSIGRFAAPGRAARGRHLRPRRSSVSRGDQVEKL